MLVAFNNFTLIAQQSNTVIINELSQGDLDGSYLHDHEWIELVVTADNTDLRGAYITTTNANSSSFPSGYVAGTCIQFTQDGSLSALPAGTIIVIYKSTAITGGNLQDPTLGGSGTPTPDVNFTGDNAIMIPSDNATFLQGTWPEFKNFPGLYEGDNVGLFQSDGTGIFCLSYGNAAQAGLITGNYGQVTIPNTTNLTAGDEVYWSGKDPNTNAGNPSYWVVQAYRLATPKTLNPGDNSALPVELTSFAVSVDGNTVNLSWKTATEVNNYGFELERTSGNNGWQKIGFVAGAGNSNTPKSYYFTDNPSGGTSFSYRLKQLDVDGNFKYYDAITVSFTASTEPELMQNNPNPFNPSTTIKFYIPNTSDVTIRIYDMLGKEVTTLFDKQSTAGFHNVYWNGKDSRGEFVSSGVYLYRLTAGNFSETKKMNLLK